MKNLPHLFLFIICIDNHILVQFHKSTNNRKNTLSLSLTSEIKLNDFFCKSMLSTIMRYIQLTL